MRLPSSDSAGIVGVRDGAGRRSGTIADGIECYAELASTRTSWPRSPRRWAASFRRWTWTWAAKVEEKQTVAKIWSASIAEAVAKAVLRHQTLDRERKLRADA